MTPLERLTSGLGLTRGDVTVALFLSVTALFGFFYTRFVESEKDFQRRVGMARLLAAADSISQTASLAGLGRLTDSASSEFDPLSREEAIEEGTDGEGPVELTLEDVAPIDINSAPPEILQLLPGVGEKTAEKIVAARPFDGVDDLTRVHGIGPKKLEKMRAYIVAGRSSVKDRSTGEEPETSSPPEETTEETPPKRAIDGSEEGSSEGAPASSSTDTLALRSDSTEKGRTSE